MDIYWVNELKKVTVYSEHNLQRYVKFIQVCLANPPTAGTYTEQHHICPKSLFPEYADLSINPWNSVILSSRQHYVAHWILSKVFAGPMIMAFWFMNQKPRYLEGYFGNGSRRYEYFKCQYEKYTASSEYRNFRRSVAKKQWENLDHQQNLSQKAYERWAKEEFRQKTIKAMNSKESREIKSSKMKTRWKSKEYQQQRKKEMEKQWKDEDFRKKHAENTRKAVSSEEFLAKRRKTCEERDVNKTLSEKAKSRWSNPEFAAKMKKAISDPDVLRRRSETRKRNKTNTNNNSLNIRSEPPKESGQI